MGNNITEQKLTTAEKKIYEAYSGVPIELFDFKNV